MLHKFPIDFLNLPYDLSRTFPLTQDISVRPGLYLDLENVTDTYNEVNNKFT